MFLIQPANAEYTGTLDIGNTQYPPTGMVAGTTGLGTGEQCSYDSQCISGHCVDDENDGNKYCVSGANDCVYDGNVIAAGTSECISTDTIGTCSASGSFSTSICAEGEHCSGGVCVADSSSQDSGSSGEEEETAPASSIDISALSNIEIIQGQTKKVKVEIINDGEKDLTDVKLTLSGVPLALYKITTSSFSSLEVDEKEYSYVNFSIPQNNEVKTYTVKLEVSAKDPSGVTISGTETFLLKVLPSEETKKKANQTYLNYTDVLEELGNIINQEKARGHDVSEAESLLVVVKQELGEVKKKIDDGNYYEAIQLMNDVGSKIDQIKQSLEQVKLSSLASGSQLLLYVVYTVIIVIMALAAYYFYSNKKKPTGFEGAAPPMIEARDQHETLSSAESASDTKFEEHAKRVHRYLKSLFKKDKNGFGYAS